MTWSRPSPNQVISTKNAWQNHALDETELLPERLARGLERQTIEL
jgi:hypothetical protein